MPQVATTREKVMQGYEALAEKGGYFTVRSLPYHSVAALQFDVVNQSPTDGVAYAVARRGQELVFFNYGQGDRITLANDPAHRSTYADTNLSKAKSTNGANDYVIEFVSLKCRGIKTQWGRATASPTQILPRSSGSGAPSSSRFPGSWSPTTRALRSSSRPTSGSKS